MSDEFQRRIQEQEDSRRAALNLMEDAVLARQKAEESERTYRTLFDSIDEGFVTAEVIYDDQGKAVDALFLDGNPAASRLTGGRDFNRLLLSELVSDPESHWLESYDRVSRTGIPERQEQFLATLDRWYNFHVSRVSEASAGQAPRVAIVFQDVTERRRAEEASRISEEQLRNVLDSMADITDRKQAEEALRASQEKYAALFATSPAPFLIVKPDAPRFTIVEVNDAYLTATMRTRENLVGRGMFDAFPDNPDDVTADGVNNLRASFNRALASRKPDVMPVQKYDIARPDGVFEERWWRPVNSPVLNQSGEVQAIIHHVNDVTEEHRAELAIRASEKRYRLLFTNMSEGFALGEMIWDERGNPVDWQYVEVNDAWATQTGVPVEQTTGRTAREVNPQIEPEWIENYGRVVKTGEPTTYEAYAVGFDKWFETFAFKHSENRFGLLFRDVSDRKRAEAALRANEEKYRALYNSLDEAYAVIEVMRDDVTQKWSDFLFLEVNPAFVKQTGMEFPIGKTATELLGTPNMRWAELYGQVAESGEPLRLEEREPTLNRVFDLYIFRLGEPGSRRVAVLFTDITLRKQAEAALRASEERLSLAIEIGELASWDWDVRTGQEKWNDRHFLVQGYAVGSVTPSFEAWIARLHPEDRAEAIARVERARDTRSVYAHVFRMLHPDGQIRWGAARGQFFYDDAGTPIRMIGVMEDVTQRKNIEIALCEREERLRLIVESARDYAIFTLDTERNVREWLPGAEAVFGWTKQEIEGRSGEILFTPEDRAQKVPQQETEIALREGKAPDVRWHLHKDGRRVFIEGQTVPLSEDGKHVGFLKIGQDVTQRRAAETALRESEERFRLFGEAASDLLWIRGIDDLEWEYLSPAFENIYGLKRADVMGQGDLHNWLSLLLPEDRTYAFEQIKRVQAGEQATFEYRIQRPDGLIRWMRDTDFQIPSADGHVRHIGGIGHDVTEQKQYEASVKESEERQAFLLRFNDALRAETNPDDVASLAVRLLAQELDLDHCSVLWIDATNNQAATIAQYHLPGLEPIPLNIPLSNFPAAFAKSLTQTLTLNDSANDASLTELDRQSLAALNCGALIAVPLRQGEGVPFWTLAGASTIPRVWKESEVTLIEQASERTWAAIERAKAESELRELNAALDERVHAQTQELLLREERLKILSSQLVEKEHEERKRLASVLHDDVQQLLVATKMQLGMVQRNPEKASGSQLQSISNLLDEALVATRTMVAELVPPVLREQGLENALRWVATRFDQQHGLKVEIEAEAEADPGDNNLREILFQGTRELLFNVVKHASTDQARIILKQSNEEITLCVRDNGLGFESQRLLGKNSGFGLRNLRARLEQVGGRISIESVPGNGTQVYVIVPRVHPDRVANAISALRLDRSGSERIRVMLVDDHQIVRAGIEGILIADSGIDVVGEAANGVEAIEQAQLLRPDVIIMDINMPVMDGIEASRRIKEILPETRILAITLHTKHEIATSLLDAGIAGYVGKDADPRTILKAIHELMTV